MVCWDDVGVAQAGGLLLDLVVCYCCALVGGVCCVVGGSCIYVEVWLGVLGLLSRVVRVLVMQLLSGYVAIVLV